MIMTRQNELERALTETCVVHAPIMNDPNDASYLSPLRFLSPYPAGIKVVLTFHSLEESASSPLEACVYQCLGMLLFGWPARQSGGVEGRAGCVAPAAGISRRSIAPLRTAGKVARDEPSVSQAI